MAKTILVVDNEVRYRELIAHLLREAGYQVDEADDGVSALEILEKKIFDLMICDVVMPRLNAFEVLDYIKSPLIIDFNYPHNRSPLFACRQRARKLDLFYEAFQRV